MPICIWLCVGVFDCVKHVGSCEIKESIYECAENKQGFAFEKSIMDENKIKYSMLLVFYNQAKESSQVEKCRKI